MGDSPKSKSTSYTTLLIFLAIPSIFALCFICSLIFTAPSSPSEAFNLTYPEENPYAAEGNQSKIQFWCNGIISMELNSAVLSEYDLNSICGKPGTENKIFELVPGENKFAFVAITSEGNRFESEVIIMFDKEGLDRIALEKAEQAQIEAQVEAQIFENKVNEHAKKYCDKRKSSYYSDQKYPILVFDINYASGIGSNASKYGYNLTLDDCKSNITVLSTSLADQELDTIADWGIWYGMTTTELYTSIGFPDDKNTTSSSGYTRIQHIYRFPKWNVKTLYVYTLNGEVTSSQH